MVELVTGAYLVVILDFANDLDLLVVCHVNLVVLKLLFLLDKFLHVFLVVFEIVEHLFDFLFATVDVFKLLFVSKDLAVALVS